MLNYLRRLASTGAAYTAASVVSKLLAVALLPLYTSYLSTADYGAAEVMFTSVVVASIIVRLGLIEALLRFYYLPKNELASPSGARLGHSDGDAVVRTGFAALFWATTAGALIALPFAEPISQALLDRDAADLVRISIGGLWVLTLYEYLVTLFRLDERAKAYFTFTILHVLAAVPLQVLLVVGLDEGARGLLLGSYLSGIPFILWFVWSERRRLGLVPDRELLRRMVRFGLPTMPAEVSLYSLQFLDRIIIVRTLGLAEAGLYALAFKFSQAVQIVVRGFQLAWPPLAYSIQDDEQARRTYAVVLTAFSAVCGFLVVGLWLEARWIVRLLADERFFDSYEVVGPLALGAALYGVYLAQLVILGRTGRTDRNLPATLAGTVVNVALNLILVPAWGIIGAGVALIVSYLVVIVLMYAFTQRLFPIPWQWGRLAVIVGAGALIVGAGELLLPDEGLSGFVLRAALWLLYPVVLWFGGVVTPAERATAIAAIRAGRERSGEGDGAEELIEAETRDQDRSGF